MDLVDDDHEANGRNVHFGFGHPFADHHHPGRTFQATYRCFSVTILGEKDNVDKGGKIIMPPSALDQLTRLNIQYPMLFKLTNTKANRETHCGVLEFVADEGRIFIPYWMMKNLCLDEGELVHVDNLSLSVATYAKFQPQSVEFLDITNPKAVLENALRNFACLTQGDVIAIKYNDKTYEMLVLETQPGKAVSIIECDMRVDFATPVGYTEPERPPQYTDSIDSAGMMDTDDTEEVARFKPFGGLGNRLDGKKKGVDSDATPMPTNNGGQRRGIPNYNFKRGTISFIRCVRPVQNGNSEEDEKLFEAFSGQGQTLKKKNRK